MSGVAIEAELGVIVIVFIGRVVYGIFVILVKLARRDRVLQGLAAHHVHFLLFDGLRPGRTARETGEVDLKQRVGKIVLIVDLFDVLHHDLVVFEGQQVGKVGWTRAKDLEIVEQHAVDLMLELAPGRSFRHQYNLIKT